MEALDGTGARTVRKRLGFRAKSLLNMLRMGHCAPTVMKSMLEISGSEEEWPIEAAAGLPGGIGDTGFECGGITSPLLFFGLRYGLRDPQSGLPLIFYKGHEHFRRFVDRNGTPFCREIRGDPYRLRRCIKAVCTAPEIAAAALSGEDGGEIVGDRLEAYSLLYAHMAAGGFHCAHRVLLRLRPSCFGRPELIDATSAYLGGTLFKGLTCSAYAAGVMALGLNMGEFENSFPRVLRMIVLMKTGGNAFADRINKFNKFMNLGNSLAQWFGGEYGSTQCRDVTGCDFSSPSAVRAYIETDGLARCRDIADRVADKVLTLSAAG